DLSAVAQAYSLGVPAVGGHSLGGIVATAYGVQHPSCPGVINIDGHGRGRVDQYVGYGESEVRNLWAQGQRRLDRLTTGVGALAVKGLLVALRKNPTTTAATLRRVTQEVETIDLFELYGQLTCPLLVFNATAPENGRLMKLLAGNGAS